MDPVESVLIHMGVDIGQKHDPTAFVVAEVLPSGAGPTAKVMYEVRDMRRVPLGTSYPDVATRLVEALVRVYEQVAVRAARLSSAGILLAPPSITLYIDQTGVGAPVVDILRRAVAADMRTQRCQIVPLTFVHGEKFDRWGGRVGKAYLVSRLSALLQQGNIKLPPNHAEAEAMARELTDYEIHINAADAHDSYGAFKVGTFDDLATALGLAVVDDPRNYVVTYLRNPWFPGYNPDHD